MSNRQSWYAGAAAIVGCLILNMLLNRPSQAEEKKTASEPAAGRYQGFGDRQIIVIDTQTGRCWAYGGKQEWQDHGSPAKEKKE